jgi:hypothetical protein
MHHCHSESRRGRDEESPGNPIATRFFVVPLAAGLLRMTIEKRLSGWTLVKILFIGVSRKDFLSSSTNHAKEW